MKTTNSFLFSKKTLLIIPIVLLLLSFISCGKKIMFQTSSVVPAARGEVKVKKDDNKNYVISIKINGLAEANRLEPSSNVYVVWMETDDSKAKNIGQIKSDSKMLSSKLKATFETVTAFKPKKIFITAEDNADVQYPRNQLVLETNKF